MNEEFEYTEEHTIARLEGKPIFTVGRKYSFVDMKSGLFGKCRYTFRFDNNYGASVILWSNDSRIDPSKPYELAILYFRGTVSDVDYTTPLGTDVIQYCGEHDVDRLLSDIEKFSPKIEHL